MWFTLLRVPFKQLLNFAPLFFFICSAPAQNAIPEYMFSIDSIVGLKRVPAVNTYDSRLVLQYLDSSAVLSNRIAEINWKLDSIHFHLSFDKQGRITEETSVFERRDKKGETYFSYHYNEKGLVDKITLCNERDGKAIDYCGLKYNTNKQLVEKFRFGKHNEKNLFAYEKNRLVKSTSTTYHLPDSAVIKITRNFKYTNSGNKLSIDETDNTNGTIFNFQYVLENKKLISMQRSGPNNYLNEIKLNYDTLGRIKFITRTEKNKSVNLEQSYTLFYRDTVSAIDFISSINNVRGRYYFSFSKGKLVYCDSQEEFFTHKYYFEYDEKKLLKSMTDKVKADEVESERITRFSYKFYEN